MVRTPRQDAPGRFHHIYNRAARRQVLFADKRDFRYFQLLLACAVRRGELVIHGYCLMSTHFHLLAASPDGRISYTMMRIQNAYARYRNRRSRQDGPVFRGRFGSRPANSFIYWLTLLRYLAHNPVDAALCIHPFEYPHGSARLFAGTRSVRWFDRNGVLARLEARGADGASSRAFARLIRAPLTRGEAALIERRMTHPRVAEDDLDELYRAPPPLLARWMARKIEAAGGRSPWIPIASPHTVLQAVKTLEERERAWTIRFGRKPHDAWRWVLAGLLHSLACVSMDEAASIAGCHRATAARWTRLHEAQMLKREQYAERVGLAARASIDATFPK